MCTMELFQGLTVKTSWMRIAFSVSVVAAVVQCPHNAVGNNELYKHLPGLEVLVFFCLLDLEFEY